MKLAKNVLLLALALLCLQPRTSSGLVLLASSLSITANTEATINFVGGTKLVLKGTSDATVIHAPTQQTGNTPTTIPKIFFH